MGAAAPPAQMAQPPMGPPVGGPDQGSYSPPVPQGGVNPLGGTVAADQGGFAAAFGGAPPPGMNYGAPPGGPPPYGAPQGGPPQYGAPAQAQYGAQPDPYGGAPNPYGQQPPQQAGGWGQPQGQMAPYGQAPGGAMQQPGIGTLQSAGVGTQPMRRNALMTFLVPALVMFGGFILGAILMVASLPLIGSLLILAGALAGAVMFLLSAIKMVNEVKAVTKNAAFPWWPIFVPVYSIYWMWFMVPAEVGKAKQMVGAQNPPRSIVLYIFLWQFALASDINDLVR
jgi:hypothetical protein